MEIEKGWVGLPVETWRGVIPLIGAPDTGKSTLGRYLFQRACASGLRVAYLDGDPGQSMLGPPGTLSVVLAGSEPNRWPPKGPAWRWFVGAVSPRGHMLPELVGVARLANRAKQHGAQVVIWNTNGLVEPESGGVALKMAGIDLLQPETVVAIQRDEELLPLLYPLEKSRRILIHTLAPSHAVKMRSPETRRAYRRAQFRAYFDSPRRMVFDWRQVGVLPAPHFTLGNVLALEEQDGFTLALGVVIDVLRREHQVVIHTREISRSQVKCLHLGDFRLDLESYQDI